MVNGRRYIQLVLLFLFALTGSAQDSETRNKEVMHSTLFGIGRSNVLDSYLSPYDYTGMELRVVRHTMRMTHLMSEHVAYQTMIDAGASRIQNHAGNVKEWAGGFRYSNAWIYDFQSAGMPVRGLHIFAGPAASGYIGGVYNERNGNNPAQAKFDVMIDAEALVTYDLRLWKRTFPIKYQLNVPLIGAAFSPNYGQSYYEIFTLGNYDHNAVFSYIGNMPSMRHLLTVDIPVGRSLVRVGYAGEFMQSTFNGIRYHSYSNDFMIGWTKYFNRK